jgi:WD40 repeat protein
MPIRPDLPLLVCAGLLMPTHARARGAADPAGLGKPAQQMDLGKRITALRYSPDGRWLVFGCADGTVWLRHADTLRERRVFDAPKNGKKVTAVDVSPDGKLLGAVYLDGNVRLFDVASGKVRRELGSYPWFETIAFSPDGKTLALGGLRGITIFNYQKGLKKQREYSRPTVRHLAFSADGKKLLASGARLVRLTDPAEGKEERGWMKEQGWTAAGGIVRLAQRGRWLLGVYAHGNEIIVCDFSTGDKHAFRQDEKPQLEDAVITPNGRLVVVATDDGYVHFLDLKGGVVRYRMRISLGGTRRLALTPDSKRLALATADGSLRTWDLPREWIRPWDLPWRWRWQASNRSVAYRGHKATVHAVGFSPDGKVFASGDADGTVYLWEGGKDEPAATFAAGGRGVRALAFSPDGKTLAAAGLDGAVRLYDCAARKLRATLRHPTTPVLALAFHPAGRLLAAGTSDGRVTLWDLAREKEQYALDAHRGPTRALAFSPDGKTLLSSGSDGRVHLWDVASEKALHTFSQKGSALALALSADGKLLASAGSKGVLHLWDLPRRRVLATRSGLGKFVIALGFNPETGKGGGRLLASASLEKGVLLWRVDPTGKTDMVGEVPGNKGPARCLTFSPDGRWLATGGTDRAVRLWALGPAEW